jgi:uracil-DNA glycosylase
MMNTVQQEFKQLLNEVSKYFDYQKSVYGSELYNQNDWRSYFRDVAEIKQEELKKLSEELKACQKCLSAQSRRHVILGEGNPNAEIMIIGEAPSPEDDFQGRVFVGAVGDLLTKILAAINLKREEVFLTNILKCKPSQNRSMLSEEQNNCQAYLFRQIDIIKPKFILTLGQIPANILLTTFKPVTELRGNVHDFKNSKLVVTHHPATLLLEPQLKRETWEDVQLLQKIYQSG